jgi:hypothetical protein
MEHSMLEQEVRDALRSQVLDGSAAEQTVDEFWMPCTNARADLVAVGSSLDGFEIKTSRDTLRRLPRQALAYGRVFDTCTAVVDERHRDAAVTILPDWWGITVIHSSEGMDLVAWREARANPEVDPATIVRLLWRDEAASALARLGREVTARTSRGAMWEELLTCADVDDLRLIVRQAIIRRNPARARIPTRRFKPAGAAAADE